MTLSTTQTQVIQDTFSRIVPRADEFAESFYATLFQTHPEVRQLFPAEMSSQREKLISTLTFVVRGLGDFSRIQSAVEDLGVRHVSYKASPALYGAVGECLIRTLADFLGAHFTTDARAAWQSAYKALSDTMIGAGQARMAG